MKVWLFVTITYLAGGVQTNTIPMDSMDYCREAARQIVLTNSIPNTTVTAVCIVQGR